MKEHFLKWLSISTAFLTIPLLGAIWLTHSDKLTGEQFVILTEAIVFGYMGYRQGSKFQEMMNGRGPAAPSKEKDNG